MQTAGRSSRTVARLVDRRRTHPVKQPGEEDRLLPIGRSMYGHLLLALLAGGDVLWLRSACATWTTPSRGA